MITLFDHNFDLETGRSTHKDAASKIEAIADLKEQLEAARKEGFEAGRALGHEEAKTEFDAGAAARFEQERQIIQEQLAQLAAQDKRHHRDTERDIIELFLGVADRLMPELITQYGPALAIDRIKQAVQQTRTDPELTISASPEVVAALDQEAPSWLTAASQTVEIDLFADPEMPRGAAQVRWQGGRLEYDIETACTQIQQALAQAASDYNEAT
ncbi:FliH/SctL family protein [Sulfitobacter pacificus]|uniref:FliH/SctL family protein n=1 Tax=Sulfitobacter pacificus TaxID=1499314 RepID=UPI003102DB24